MIALHGEFRGVPALVNSGTIVRDLSVPVKVQIYNVGLDSLKLTTIVETVLEPGESSGEMLINPGETLQWFGTAKFQWRIYFDHSAIPFGGTNLLNDKSGTFIDKARTTTLISIKNLGLKDSVKLQGEYSEEILPSKEITLLLEQGDSLFWSTRSLGEYRLAEVGFIMESALTKANLKSK